MPTAPAPPPAIPVVCEESQAGSSHLHDLLVQELPPRLARNLRPDVTVELLTRFTASVLAYMAADHEIQSMADSREYPPESWFVERDAARASATEAAVELMGGNPWPLSYRISGPALPGGASDEDDPSTLTEQVFGGIPSVVVAVFAGDADPACLTPPQSL